MRLLGRNYHQFVTAVTPAYQFDKQPTFYADKQASISSVNDQGLT
jgi:hypothetical protein